MSGQSKVYRYKRQIIAAWINDALGKEDVPDCAFWPDAADLIKFMKAHGLEITQCTPGSLEVVLHQEDILSRLSLLAEQVEDKPMSDSPQHPRMTTYRGPSGWETHIC